jgi:hypothetical protein
MPVYKPWIVYDEWRKTYGRPFASQWSVDRNNSEISGDMIHLNVLGQHFVILNSLELITDLFEKRSSNYSNRKQTTMLIELYVSSHSFHPEELVKKMLFDTEWVGYKHDQDAIWPMVAETQEIILRVFPP